MKAFSSIGIYPEWNVKVLAFDTVSTWLSIGIYPEWNVKLYLPLSSLLACPNWNISRMECKVTSIKNVSVGLLLEYI